MASSTEAERWCGLGTSYWCTTGDRSDDNFLSTYNGSERIEPITDMTICLLLYSYVQSTKLLYNRPMRMSNHGLKWNE